MKQVDLTWRVSLKAARRCRHASGSRVASRSPHRMALHALADQIGRSHWSIQRKSQIRKLLPAPFRERPADADDGCAYPGAP
jgi:hypothetical protein